MWIIFYNFGQKLLRLSTNEENQKNKTKIKRKEKERKGNIFKKIKKNLKKMSTSKPAMPHRWPMSTLAVFDQNWMEGLDWQIIKTFRTKLIIEKFRTELAVVR